MNARRQVRIGMVTPCINLVHIDGSRCGERIGRQYAQCQRDDRVMTGSIRDSGRVGSCFRQAGKQLIRIRLVVAGRSRIFVVGITYRFGHLQCIYGIRACLRVVVGYHIHMYLIVCLIIADKRLGRLTIGRSHKRIVAIAIGMRTRSLTIGERNGFAIHGKRTERMVVDHLDIVDIKIVVVVGLVE